VRNLAVTVIDRLVLVVHGAEDPTPVEWDAYLELVAHHGIEKTMQLTYTAGGEPTSAQRRRLSVLLDGRAVPVAVVSPSVRVRGTVTALSWLNRKTRAFSPSELPEALAYLEIPPTRGGLIAAELHKLQTELREGAQCDP
jgi:hypothetical protein